MTIKGNVLACTKREIVNTDGSKSNFFELMVDFGGGAVIVSSGKEAKLGSWDFEIVPRTMYDRKPKISFVPSKQY